MILCLLLVALAAQAQPDSRISVYVGAPMRDGFVDADKDVLDSIKDLQNEIRKKKKQLRLAPNPETADLILWVNGRGIASEHNGVIALPVGRGIVVRDAYANHNVVHTTLQVGDYRKDFTAAFRGIGDVWGECAEQVVKQLSAWVSANDMQIRERTRRR